MKNKHIPSLNDWNVSQCKLVKMENPYKNVDCTETINLMRKWREEQQRLFDEKYHVYIK